MHMARCKRIVVGGVAYQNATKSRASALGRNIAKIKFSLVTANAETMNLNSRSPAGPTARLPSNSNAVASGNGTSFHCLLPRLPWLYSHRIAILAAARAASGARSPTRKQSSATPHTSRYPHPPSLCPTCASCPHLLISHLVFCVLFLEPLHVDLLIQLACRKSHLFRNANRSHSMRG